MDKQQRILGALNLAAILVCGFFIAFLYSIGHVSEIIYFVGGLVVFLANVLLIRTGRLRAGYITFAVCCNVLVLLFDTGITNPTASFAFYFPLLFASYLLTARQEWKARMLVFGITLSSIFLTNFTQLTPRLAGKMAHSPYAADIALFNVTVSLLLSVYIFRSYIRAYRAAQEEVESEKDKLLKSTELLKAINQNIDVGICKTDGVTGRLLYVNKAYLNLFGYDDEADALASSAQNNYMEAADREKVIGLLKQTGLVNNMEIRYRRKDGSTFWGLLSSASVQNEDGSIAYDGAVRDITYLKEMETELLKAKEQAERLSQEKSRFLSTMSHEIRTPMSAVIAISNLLLKDDPKDNQLDSLSLLKFSAENLMLLLNNVLDFTKIEAGMVELENLPVDVSDLVAKVVKVHESQTLLKDIQVNFENEMSFGSIFMTDPTRLTQVMNNLVSNAVKFTDVGVVTTRLSEEPVDAETTRLTFTVTDTGVGIEPQKLEMIFESFTQEDSSITRKFGGTGLGLAITKKLIELMGSELKVRSQKGKGSEFSFSLLLRKSPETPIRYGRPVPEQRDVNGMKVLLVEDNISNIAVGKKYLEKWELEFDIVDSGDSAINLVKAKEFDVILMDLHMPGLDGYETTRRIREFNQSTPIIALTANSFSEARTKALSIGMNDFISKPFKADELYDKLASYNVNAGKS